MTSKDGVGHSVKEDKGQPKEIDLDRDLEAVAKNGDSLAFKRLFADLAPRLKYFLIKRGLAESAAEDVLFDPSKASASTWVYTIARNVRIDRLRKESRPEPDPNDPCYVPDDPETGEQAVSRKQDRERISKAMAVLPPEQMKIIRMSFFDEKSHGEIAEELDIPLGTVKSRLRLAFGKIRAELEVY